MKFDLVSDLHLEIGGIKELIDSWVVGSDLLIMAGDIVEIAELKKNKNSKQKNIREFFKFISKNYKQVFWVFGNHEFWHGNIDYDFDNAKSILKRLEIHNIQILNDEYATYVDLMIFGGTLWTSMRNSNPITMSVCRSGMNDYVMISRYDEYLEKRLLVPEDTVMLHNRTVRAIERFIQIPKEVDKKKLVITHHLPCWLSVSDDRLNDPLTDAYATELSEMIFDSGIDCWVHGHSHEEVEYDLENCKVVSNPRGYYGYESSAYNYAVKTRLYGITC